MNPLDWLLNRKKVDNTARIEQEMKPLIQKANARNVQKFKSGQINNDQYQKQFQTILGNGRPIQKEQLTGFDKFTEKAANKVSENRIARPLLTGLASLSPTNAGGEIAGYGGRYLQALGWKDGKYLAEAGDNVANYSKPTDKFANRGMSDTLINGGVTLAGDIINNMNPVTAATTLSKYFTSSANDMSRGMEKAGYTPKQSFLGGSAVALPIAALEKISLNTIGGEAGGAVANKLISKIPQKIADNTVAKVVSRLAGSAITEGATEGLQELVANTGAKATFDPQRSLMQNVKESAIAGGILGAGARGGVEIMQANANRPQTPLTPELQSKRNALEIAQSQAVAQGRPQTAQAIAQQIQEIDNPSPGTLREQIRSAKNTVVGAYQQKTALPNNVQLSDNALQTLTDFGDYKGGQYNPDIRTLNQLQADAYQIAKEAGIDVTSGSPIDIQSRITDFVEDYKFRANAPRQGGFIGNGDTNPLESLKQAYNKMDDETLVSTVNDLERYGSTDNPTYKALKEVYAERKLGGIQDELRKQDVAKQTKQVEATKAKKDLDGFTDNKSSVQRGKIEKTLDSQVRYNGEVMSKRDYIRKLVKDGYVPDEKSNSIYSPNDRSSYQVVTKTEADYARHLATQSQPPKSPLESLKQEARNIQATIESPYLNSLPPTQAQSKLAGYRRRLAEINKQLNANDTALNGNEPKINAVERKITETEPKRTEKATQSQPPKSPLSKAQKPKSDGSLTKEQYDKQWNAFQKQSLEELKKTDGYVAPKDIEIREVPIKSGAYKGIPQDVAFDKRTGKELITLNTGAMKNDVLDFGYSPYKYPSEPFIYGSVENAIEFKNRGKSKPPLTVVSKTKKPFTPISQPVDNIPAVAKQVTNGSTSTKQNQSEIQPTSQAVLPNPKTSTQNKVQGSNQSKVRSQTIDSTDSASSSQENPLNNMGSIPSDEQLDNQTNQESSRPADEFDAVAANPKSKKTRVLVDAIKADTTLTEASRTAQMEGSELNYYAKKDDTGRSVGIEQFDPKNHRIEAGFVIDSNGKVLGNHIKVDDTGIQVNVGGEIVNIETIVGNPQDWDGNYRMMETMDRNIQRLAPDEATYRKTRRFTVDHKIKSEANFRTELKGQRQQLAERAKPVMKARPRGVSKSEYNADIFDFIEGNKTKAEITKKYGKVVSEKISTYQKETRKMYDDILERVNETFVKFGEPPVPKRADYLTHINELNSKPSFAGEIYGQLQNSILGEGMNTTRGTVPSDIAGRTENFQPRKKWNRFFQARNGGEFTKDPFKAVDAYLEPSLYNIHMTESAVRARAVESAFRTAEVIRKTDAKTVSEEFGKTIEKYGNADTSKLVTGFQEWANALAGKTQRFDRQIIDASKGTALGLKGWQALQRVGGRGTILGNVQSVLSQTLNQPMTLADAGPINYAKGIATALTGGTPIEQSSFITARATNAESNYKSRGGKILDAGGIPLQAVELAMVKTTWNAQYHKAVSDGYKGNEAVLEADRRTEQVVAGRGIADRPEAYRSTAVNGLLQYTLEVSATKKKFFQDLNTTQKAEFVVATFAMNSLMGLVTGAEPLPDLLGSIIDTAGDLLDDEDDRDAKSKLGGGAKDLVGESVSMNPLLTAGVNTFMSQDQRKSFFGENSSLGRFEGTAAPVQVLRNVVDSGISTAEGKYTDARNKIMKTFPFGNQAQKTVRGVEALRDGYAVDNSGNPTYSVSNDPVNALKTIMFGPNSAREAKSYYDKNQTKITGKEDLKAIESSANKSETVAQIQERRLNNREDENATPTVNNDQGNSRDELIKRLNDDDKSLSDTEKTLAKFYKDMPKNLSEESIAELAKYERLNPNSKKRLYKGVNAQIRLKTAELERDTATGVLNTAQEFDRKKEIAKLEVAKPYGETVADMYGLSLYELESVADQDTYDKLVAYDKDLFLNDLIDKPKFKVNKVYTSKGGRGGGSGGSKKIDTTAVKINNMTNDSYSKLSQLLSGINKPVTSAPKKVAVRKPVLKQIKVRA